MFLASSAYLFRILAQTSRVEEVGADNARTEILFEMSPPVLNNLGYTDLYVGKFVSKLEAKRAYLTELTRMPFLMSVPAIWTVS